MIGRGRAPAQDLIFEITETAAIEHLDAAREFAERLTRLGCRFALDDFGTGFGSLTYLRRLPVRLPEDRHELRHAALATSPEDQAMVRGDRRDRARAGGDDRRRGNRGRRGR